VRAYRSQILKYLNEYEKPRTTEEIMDFLVKQRGAKNFSLTERRKLSIVACLKKLEAEKLVYSKKTKKRKTYWAGKEEYLSIIESEIYKTSIKDLLKEARKTGKPIKFFRG
jgi:hypothetical protein